VVPLAEAEEEVNGEDFFSTAVICRYDEDMKHLAFLAASLLLGTSTAFAADAAPELTVLTSRPSAGSIPRGAQRVPLLTITLNASCSADVTVDELRLHHAGLGNPEDITSLYATDGRMRLSRTTSFSGNNRTATLRLTRLTIERCTSKTVQIAADFSVSAENGGEHRAELKTVADIVAGDALVTIKADTSGATLRTAPSTSGTITVSYPPLRSTVKYGNNRTLGRLKLEADNEDDHAISSITLTNEGKARDTDLQNLYLETSAGEKISGTLRKLDGDKAVFVFSEPFILEKNQARVLEVKGNVRAASKKTIRFEVEEASDIVSTIAKQRGQRFQ